MKGLFKEPIVILSIPPLLFFLYYLISDPAWFLYVITSQKVLFSVIFGIVAIIIISLERRK